jgi:hypothetical protein
MSANKTHCEDSMKHARSIKFLGVMAAVAGVSAAVAQALPADAAAASAKPVVVNCSYKLVTRPANFTPYCADYGIVLEHMHWTSWNGHLASGYGTVSENDEYPSHAAGKIFTVPALVTFWGSAAVRGHHGDRTYTTMTLIFPGKRPAVYNFRTGKASYPVTQTVGF